MKSASIVLAGLACLVLSSGASAQKMTAERAVDGPGSSIKIVREMRLPNGEVVTLKHSREADGSLLLRGADQTSYDLDKLDRYCTSRWGAGVARDAVVTLSKDAIAMLPCAAISAPPRSRQKPAEVDPPLTPPSARAANICGNVSVIAGLYGPSTVGQGSSEMFEAEGIYEYDSGPGATASLNGSVLPSCNFGASAGIMRFGWALMPFACVANISPGTYGGSATAELCGESDTAYKNTSVSF